MAQDRYKLKLTALKFISAVDMPAQETAKAVLLKRADATSSVKATARVVKTSDELGLVFGWAFTHAADGADYYDVHGHNILEDDVIKVAADFLAAGGDTDEMHDRSPDGKVVFAMPMTTEVAKSFGITTDTTGLMIAIKPSPTVFAKFKSGELTGFSIDGEGLETKIAKRTEAVRFAKAMLLLECEAGHTHFLDDQAALRRATRAASRCLRRFRRTGTARTTAIHGCVRTASSASAWPRALPRNPDGSRCRRRHHGREGDRQIVPFARRP